MTDEEFFQRLRGDARALRHQPDEATLARIRVAISSRLTTPTVADLLAAWFRPLAATALALSLAAVIGTTIMRGDDIVFADTDVEITSAGETYRVGD
ncbi:MAG TPA: hypothetical protein VEK79_04690 [Thermoanaerobaculia bacterium]|nr:hypothetical protein [Thermoanaerobaculia bacterium]